LITQNHIAEFLALATSIIYWPSVSKGKLYWLPFFLFSILLIELTGSFLPRVLHRNNVWLYNISIPFEYLFYLFLFNSHGYVKQKVFIKISTIALVIIAIVSFAFSPISVFHNYVLLTGQVLVITASCIYLYERFHIMEDKPLIKDYFFWITGGLLLFNLGDLSYTLLFPLILHKQWDDFGVLFKSINNSLLLMLYLSYIIAVIIHKKYSTANA
jgi:hypothetical protein